MKVGLSSDERKKSQRKSLQRMRKAAHLQQRTALEPVHYHERGVERVPVSLEMVRAGNQVAHARQFAYDAVLARSFLISVAALIEAQHQRTSSRDLRQASVR